MLAQRRRGSRRVFASFTRNVDRLEVAARARLHRCSYPTQREEFYLGAAVMATLPKGALL